MPALSAYIHSRGLKFGMYTDIGNASCGKGPGSYGHYAADATTFATEWQIDALKVDFCDFWFIPEQLKLWQQFRDALNATGRPIWLYTSPHSGGSMPVAAHGISAPWHGAHPYSPPPEWSAQTVRGLANSMMFQYVNLFDFLVVSALGRGDEPTRRAVDQHRWHECAAGTGRSAGVR